VRERKSEQPAKPVSAPEAPKQAVVERTLDPAKLGFPTHPVEVVTYLATQYKGVGQKMAESLIEAFGAPRVFRSFLEHPERVKQILGERRGEKLIEAWQQDYDARMTSRSAESETPVEPDANNENASPARSGARRRGRRGGRRRRGVARPAE
jgi:hypothetical protein